MKMMVYKDKEKILKKLYSILESIGKENGLYIFLLTPKNVHSLKEYICNNNIDVMLLDIFIEEDVLNLMKKTSESNQKMKMIFTPLMYHNILKCYEIKVIKNNITPVDKDKIDPIVKDWSNQLIDRNGKFIIEKNDSGFFKIYFDEILCIETYNRNTLVHTLNEDILSYKNMKQHMARLNSSFIRCHNSYIVNMAYIKSYRGNEIYLTNNKVVWVSKSRRKEFLKSLSDYYENYLNV